MGHYASLLFPTTSLFLSPSQSNHLLSLSPSSCSIRIADLGIARILGKTTQQANTMIGTLVYDSPEFLKELPYSFPADIWALGVTMYQLATLNHPFASDSAGKMLFAILLKDPDPIPQLTGDETNQDSLVLAVFIICPLMNHLFVLFFFFCVLLFLFFFFFFFLYSSLTHPYSYLSIYLSLSQSLVSSLRRSVT